MRGQNRRDVLMGAHFRAKEKSGARETPRNTQGRHQLRSLAVIERVPELAIYCSQIGDFPNCHQTYPIQ